MSLPGRGYARGGHAPGGRGQATHHMPVRSSVPQAVTGPVSRNPSRSSRGTLARVEDSR